MVDRWRKERAQNQNIFIEKILGNNQYLVNGSRGYEYAVDLNIPSCECPDWQKRQPDGGCKHIIYVKMETNSTSNKATTYTDPATGTKLDTSTSGDPLTDKDIPTAYNHKEEWSETVTENINSADKKDDSESPSSIEPASGTEHNKTPLESTQIDEHEAPENDNKESLSEIVEKNSFSTTERETTTDQSKIAENNTTIYVPIIGGILLAALVSIPIEITFLLLDIPLGTLVTRFGMVLILIEGLVILGYVTNKDSTGPSLSQTEDQSRVNENIESNTPQPESQPLKEQDSPQDTTKPVSESTDSPEQVSDEAWQRKQDQGSPNRYRGPGRY